MGVLRRGSACCTHCTPRSLSEVIEISSRHLWALLFRSVIHLELILECRGCGEQGSWFSVQLPHYSSTIFSSLVLVQECEPVASWAPHVHRLHLPAPQALDSHCFTHCLFKFLYVCVCFFLILIVKRDDT